MRRYIPPTTALKCFESAAKHESFTQAADELCLTQSAVSRQVKKLEEMLGCKLFERVKQRLFLTDVGKAYQPQVSHILDQLESTTLNIRKKIKGHLRIGVEDALMTHWLIPKLHDFQQQYPDIETEFISDLHLLYDRHEGFDIGILMGNGQWPDLQAQYLIPERLLTICTPELREKYGELHSMRDVLNYPFLHHTPSVSSTQMWLKEAGLSAREIQHATGPRFSNFKQLIQAAKQGMGLTIVPQYLAQETIDQGELVMPYPEVMHCHEGYHIVIPNNQACDHKIKAFSEWLLSWG